jgi:hypothetical protein
VAFLQSDYPGLFRVVISIQTLFGNVVRNAKRQVRDDDTWKKLLPEVYGERDKLQSLEKVRIRLLHIFMAFILTTLKDKSQPNINDVLNILDLTVDAYLACTDKGLYALSRKEKGVQLVSMSETKTISDDLRQAEKCLSLLLRQDELLSYREHISRQEINLQMIRSCFKTGYKGSELAVVVFPLVRHKHG